MTASLADALALISAGTERATVETGASSLLGKARQRPDQVRQVLNTARQLGVVETYRMVQDRLVACHHVDEVTR